MKLVLVMIMSMLMLRTQIIKMMMKMFFDENYDNGDMLVVVAVT
jgi:hypothetical protein